MRINAIVANNKIIVVSEPIEADRQKVDAVEAVLLPVRLQLDKQHPLSQPVGGFGLLGVPVPEVFLLEGGRGELGAGADGAT